MVNSIVIVDHTKRKQNLCLWKIIQKKKFITGDLKAKKHEHYEHFKEWITNWKKCIDVDSIEKILLEIHCNSCHSGRKKVVDIFKINENCIFRMFMKLSEASRRKVILAKNLKSLVWKFHIDQWFFYNCFNIFISIVYFSRNLMITLDLLVQLIVWQNIFVWEKLKTRMLIQF